MANWRKIGKMSATSTAVAATILASGYGLADAAAPGSVPFHFTKAHHRAPRAVTGTVTSVGTGSFTISLRNQQRETILTTSATQYHQPGTSTPPTGVAVGETVTVYLVHEHRAPATTSTTVASTSSTTAASTASSSSGAVATLAADTATSTTSPTAAYVNIDLFPVSGKVTAISGSTITVSGRHGHSTTINTTGATTYLQGKDAATASAVAVGDFIVAWVNPAAPATPLDAVVVDIFQPRTPPSTTATTTPPSTTATTAPPSTTATTAPPSTTATTTSPSPQQHPFRINGRVVSVSGDTIVLQVGRSHQVTITTTGTTTYFKGRTATTASAVTVGERLFVEGTATDPGSSSTSSTGGTAATASATPAQPTLSANVVEILPATPKPPKPVQPRHREFHHRDGAPADTRAAAPRHTSDPVTRPTASGSGHSGSGAPGGAVRTGDHGGFGGGGH